MFKELKNSTNRMLLTEMKFKPESCIYQNFLLYFLYGENMKKIFSFLIFIFALFINFNSTVFAATWPELTQKERDEYIRGSLEDIKAIDDIDISDRKLKKVFDMETTRDPNYRTHREGKTNLKGVEVSLNRTKYYPPNTPYLLGENSYYNIITIGYKLKADGIELTFNKGGSLTGIKAQSTLSSYGTFVVKEYNRSKELQTMYYSDQPYTIFFDNDGEITKITEHGKPYDIKGNSL